MAVNAILALFAVTASASASAAEHRLPSHLGVTATVVRLAEIVPISASDDGTVAIVRNAASVQVLAVGGTVFHSDEDTAVVSSDATDPLIVTLVY